MKKNIFLLFFTFLIAVNNSKAIGLSEAIERLKSNDPTLTSLNLSGNEIGDFGAQALAEALTENNTLTSLNLSVNDIGDLGAQALAEALAENNTLTLLGLSGNKIGVKGAQALAEALRVNNTITTFNLRFNLRYSSVVVMKSIEFFLDRNKLITPLKLDFLKTLKEAFCFLDRVDGNIMKLQAKKERAKRLFNSYIILPIVEKYELDDEIISEEREDGEEDTIYFDKNFLLNRLSLSEENFKVFIEYLSSRTKQELISFFYWLYSNIYFDINSEQIINDIIGDFMQNYGTRIEPIPLNQILEEMLMEEESSITED